MRTALSSIICAALIGSAILLVSCFPKYPADDRAQQDKRDFPLSKEERAVAREHAGYLEQMGGYDGPQTCYACHTEEYREVSRSYHAHQGRIAVDGSIAHEPEKAVDRGMFTRWYPLTQVDRSMEPENQWRLQEALRCGQCHPGGGPMKRYGLDVDCLICHQRGGYPFGQPERTAWGGRPAGDKTRVALIFEACLASQGQAGRLDLSDVAANTMQGREVVVGRPAPENCTFCHQRTGHKRGTRYGKVLGSPADVHYDLGFRCQLCHPVKDHEMGKGRILDAVGTPEQRGTMHVCFDCHGTKPHAGLHAQTLNDHMATIACETCHVTETRQAFRRVDWTPGLDLEEKLAEAKGGSGARNAGTKGPSPGAGLTDSAAGSPYLEVKKEGFTPVYAWHNPYRLSREVPQPNGRLGSQASKITPFNRVGSRFFDDGTQPRVLDDPDGPAKGRPIPLAAVARAGGAGATDTSLMEMRAWKGGRFDQALIRQPAMTFQIFHGISPASQALQCNDCHQEGGRLDFAALGYSPKRIEQLTDER